MRVLTDDPRFTPLHHAIGHGRIVVQHHPREAAEHQESRSLGSHPAEPVHHRGVPASRVRSLVNGGPVDELSVADRVMQRREPRIVRQDPHQPRAHVAACRRAPFSALRGKQQRVISRSWRLFALCPRGSLRCALAAHHMRWTPAFAHALLRVKGIKRPSDLARLHVCFLVYVARKLFC